MKHRLKARRLHPIIILSGILVVLVLAGSLSYYFVSKNDNNKKQPPVSPVNTINYGSSTAQDNASNNDRKSNPSSASTILDNGSTTGSNTISTSLSAIITHATSTGSNGTYTISTAANISGTTSGTCEFTATMSGQQAVSQSSQVEASNQNYICPAITITLPVKGSWNVSVVVISGGQSSPSSNWAENPVPVE